MCREDKIVAVILAAGYSSRMGEFKPLMKLNGKTVIESAADCFRSAGISEIRIVAGYRAGEIISLLDGKGIQFILNENYQDGMFSSVLSGLKSISDNTSGIFILPGDMPMVKPGTVKVILEEFRNSGKGIIYPCFSGERGHPPFISSAYIKEILSSEKSENLRSVLARFEDDSVNVELADQSVVMDMDTPEDFRNAERYLCHSNAPSAEECAALLSIYKTPDKVNEHGKAVCEISCRIAKLLKDRGSVDLDIYLIMAGSMLHDIARDKPGHASEGASILYKHGYPDVAKVIAGHMDIEINPDSGDVDEMSVIYLADKFVKETVFISLDERFRKSAGKSSDNPGIISNIEKREKNAHIIKERIEKITGVSDLESFLKAEVVLI